MAFEEKVKVEERELKRNGSGYSDPTAYKAIKNIDDAADSKARFYKLLDVIFVICNAYGFHLEERITVKDKKTGKIWR